MDEDKRPRPAPAPAADKAKGEGDSTPPAAGRGTTRQPPGEVGGPKGPEPTRYGDWEKGGRCSDF